MYKWLFVVVLSTKNSHLEHLGGRPQIQQSAGAPQGQRARKGVFITASAFSQTAQEHVSRLDSKIVLIDGETLAQLWTSAACPSRHPRHVRRPRSTQFQL
ncbi:MAG: restriction endonuclease [Anaerolineae bacterium]|nr:restriction endonuclease [Anaerolineae bacterium]